MRNGLPTPRTDQRTPIIRVDRTVQVPFAVANVEDDVSRTNLIARTHGRTTWEGPVHRRDVEDANASVELIVT
jgi:hypothetical protein